jgi:hypothetical protein
LGTGALGGDQLLGGGETEAEGGAGFAGLFVVPFTDEAEDFGLGTLDEPDGEDEEKNDEEGEIHVVRGKYIGGNII